MCQHCIFGRSGNRLLAASLIGALALTPAALTDFFDSGVQVGQIAGKDLVELSGIASSRSNPGVLWVHNDRARDLVYAVSTNGQLLATFNIGKEVDDFEDIAIGPGPLPELQYLYCGDIGDNNSIRNSIRVYRVAEPAVYSHWIADPPSPDFALVEKFTLHYPDGPRNAEAVMIDPLTGALYLATKQDAVSRIYRADRSELKDGATVTLSLAAEVDFHEVSGGDISPDGTEIILRQENFAKLWRRSPGQDIGEALAGASVEVPVIGMPTEPNGEGIAFDGNGLGYYTVSEGEEPMIYFFARTNGPSPPQPRALLPSGYTWKYLDNGSDQGTGWRDPAFPDVTWRSGLAQLGYGDDDEQTGLAFGSDKDQKHVTTYFRTQFQVDNPGLFQTLTLAVLFDDGIAVYLNGQEILRRNLSPNTPFSEAALDSSSSLENLWQRFSVTNALRAGTNVIAAEVHRYSRSEGDLSFDLQLIATKAQETLQFAGPPRRIAGAAWALDVRGPARSTVSIQGSSNLVNWTQLGIVSLADGTGSFTNTPVPGLVSSFYRLRQ